MAAGRPRLTRQKFFFCLRLWAEFSRNTRPKGDMERFGWIKYDRTESSRPRRNGQNRSKISALEATYGKSQFRVASSVNRLVILKKGER